MPKRKKHECSTCNTCDQGCDRDAGWTCGFNTFLEESDPPCRPLPKCYSCGEDVCRQCSSIRKYHNYGKVRLCNGCQQQLDGNYRRPLYRIARRAGYDHKAARSIVEQREGL